jgi:hypothetical protein
MFLYGLFLLFSFVHSQKFLSRIGNIITACYYASVDSLSTCLMDKNGSLANTCYVDRDISIMICSVNVNTNSSYSLGSVSTEIYKLTLTQNFTFMISKTYTFSYLEVFFVN